MLSLALICVSKAGKGHESTPTRHQAHSCLTTTTYACVFVFLRCLHTIAPLGSAVCAVAAHPLLWVGVWVPVPLARLPIT
jgi:hypothetical protein